MTTTTPAPSTATSPRTAPVLAVSSLCAVLVIAMVAAVNLAVPKLAASPLHPSSAQLLWIVDTYVLVFAGLVILGGVVGDRFGRKGTLIAGLVVFAVGAGLSAVAPDVAVVLVGRAVTGVGAAAVLPNSLAVLIHAVPPPRRPAAIGTWAAMTGVGGGVGNAAGGALLAGSWRWLFAAGVPAGLVCAAVVALLAPASSRHDRPLRPLSAALLTLASFALLGGIIEGPHAGWTSPGVLGAFAAAIVLMVVWTRSELRAEQPLLDPRVFRIPTLRGAALGMTVVFFGMFALFYVNASYLQYGKGYGVLRAGLAILPMTLVAVTARLAGPVAARIGRRSTLGLAFALITAALLLLSTSDSTTPYGYYAAYLVVLALGLSLALPGLSADIAGSLPSAQAGLGSGLQSTTREFGSALGVAVVGTVLTARFTHGLPAGISGRTVGDALAHAHDHATRLAVIHDFTSSVDTSLRVVALVTLLAGILVVAAHPRG